MGKSSVIRLFVAAAGMAGLLSADSSSVDSPLIGYVVRPAGPAGSSKVPELRAMLGVPGAARFSDAMPLPKGTRTAEAAPGLTWILCNRTSGAAAFEPASLTLTPLPVSGMPSSWAFSPTGARVALYFADRGEVALISGLPSSPALDSTVKVAPFDSFAAGDNGGFVYTSGNRVFTSSGQLLYKASGTLGPVAYETGRDAVVLYDGGSLMEAGLTGSATPRSLAAGLTACDQMFASVDKIYASDSKAGTLSIVNYADGSVASQNVHVTRIVPSAVVGTVVVSLEAAEPAWLVNAQGVSFVPAVLGSRVAESQ
ncbi:MAG TPA: hypothetical protein VGL53_24860 [Bryobacteraceae bacterium]|jgi:hypothetical protein